MGQIIINGRNGNYPTKEVLPELSEIPDTSPPYPEAEMRCISGRNRGYPKVASLPELSGIPDTSLPYPEAMMRCLGLSINNGYPCVISVAGVKKKIFSDLYFGEDQITALYYNGQLVSAAFCNGKKVFEVKYVKE